MKKLISLKLEEEILKEGKSLAKGDNKSFTQLITEILSFYVKKHKYKVDKQNSYAKINNKSGKIAIVTGAGGFIGNHLVKRLKQEGYWVRGIDLKYPEFSQTKADEFIICDLKNQLEISEKSVFVPPFSFKIFEVYALAACMGGAGFVFTGDNDAEIVYNNALVNLNTAENCVKNNVSKVFFSSSACIYPQYNQLDPENPKCSEDSAYPADPDSDYGIEKLFSERVYLAFNKNCNLDVRIARFHNIFGELTCYDGGKEKAPAAICRKISMAKNGENIEIWGDGKQTRSFLYINECLDGIRKLMNSNIVQPLNIGSEEMVTINQLVEYVMEIADKKLIINHIPGPTGVRGRNSDNKLIKEKIGWVPSDSLKDGLKITYDWIDNHIKS